MNTTIQIQQLWDYLEVRDDETLIVRSYNQTKEEDEYIVAKVAAGGLSISITSKMPPILSDKPFQLIQQRDSSGKFRIPLVTEMKKDKVNDY